MSPRPGHYFMARQNSETLTPTQLEYIEWRANPEREGSKTAWADAHHVNTSTLRVWDGKLWFKEAMQKRVAELNLSSDRLSDVLNALYKEARLGDANAAAKYLQWAEQLNPSRRVIEDASIEEMSDAELEAAFFEGLAARNQD